MRPYDPLLGRWVRGLGCRRHEHDIELRKHLIVGGREPSRQVLGAAVEYAVIVFPHVMTNQGAEFGGWREITAM